MNTPLDCPAQPAGELYCPTIVTPEEAFRALGRLRQEALDEIDRLIGFLDKLDGYSCSELEDAVDDFACDSDELEGDDRGGDANDEPDLGACNGGSQVQWSGGLDSPTDGREDDGADLEPSLCGVTFDRGSDHDLEEACEGEGELDSGIGDFDGLLEQDPARFAHCDVRVDP